MSSPKNPQSKRPVKAKRKIVSKQPKKAWQFENEWSSGLMDCFRQPKVWAYAFFCLPCYANSKIYTRTDECCLACCCVPYSLVAMRAKLRTGFRINGGICTDCLAVTCCTSCVALQLSRELDFQGL